MDSNLNNSSNTDATVSDRLFAFIQHLLPHHLLSQGMHWLTRVEWAPVKNILIRSAIRVYDVDMNEATEPNPEKYASFNKFFTRTLKQEARPISDQRSAICCPADGAVSQVGAINNTSLFQAKGHDYSLNTLLGGDAEWTERFKDGHFATIYLSPKDYHRVHMPLAGSLEKMLHVPGKLFSVNPATARTVPNLFARNERVVSLFETDAGPMAVILVGAIFVASIDTVWAGTVAPRSRQVVQQLYGAVEKQIHLDKAQEMGRFNMGSTVILLFGKNKMQWESTLVPGKSLRMGEIIGQQLTQA